MKKCKCVTGYLAQAGQEKAELKKVKALVLLTGVKIKKKACTMLSDCEASQCLCHLATPQYRSRDTSIEVAANVMNQGSCPLCFFFFGHGGFPPKV